MAISNRKGLNRIYGSTIPQDERSNTMPSGSSKKVGPKDGRITTYKKTAGMDSSTYSNANGLKNEFGNPLPVEVRKNRSWG